MSTDPAIALPAPAATVRSQCTLCPTGEHCLTGGLPEPELQQWAGLLVPHIPLPQPGRFLFSAGAVADAVYMVRAGCIKTYTVDGQGRERVRGFFFPGDVVGLDAVGAGHYPANATAVIASQVCRVTKGQLQPLLTRAPALNQRLMERLSQDLRLALALQGDYSAEQRTAAFLLHLQERLEPQRGGVLRLPMSRRDIADYLRLATETVCRVLTRFEDKHWISSEDKRITLRQPAALWELAEPVGICYPRLRLAA